MSLAHINLVPGSGGGVREALANASRATGIDFDYLLNTAQRESSLNPSAKSRSSSASGLFQFIEQTWLATLRDHGAEHGYAEQAAAIEQAPSGRLTVADPAARSAILSLRNDAEASSLMAAEFARDCRERLERSLGREVDGGELYLAHFLGPGEAARFISESEASPDAKAADSFASAAAANPSVFYSEGGGARSLAEVKARLSGTHRSPPVDAAEAGWDGLKDDPVPLFGRAQVGTTYWTPPTQTLTLTPQVLQILSMLDPIPDSRSGQKSYQDLLALDPN